MNIEEIELLLISQYQENLKESKKYLYGYAGYNEIGEHNTATHYYELHEYYETKLGAIAETANLIGIDVDGFLAKADSTNYN